MTSRPRVVQASICRQTDIVIVSSDTVLTLTDDHQPPLQIADSNQQKLQLKKDSENEIKQKQQMNKQTNKQTNKQLKKERTN